MMRTRETREKRDDRNIISGVVSNNDEDHRALINREAQQIALAGLVIVGPGKQRAGSPGTSAKAQERDRVSATVLGADLRSEKRLQLPRDSISSHWHALTGMYQNEFSRRGAGTDREEGVAERAEELLVDRAVDVSREDRVHAGEGEVDDEGVADGRDGRRECRHNLRAAECQGQTVLKV